MDLIYKYSPFKTEAEFFAQFDRIKGDSGEPHIGLLVRAGNELLEHIGFN